MGAMKPAPGPSTSEFVFLSAGPVGDHAVIIDWANRFFEATGKPSTILMKHPNAFLRDLSIPYRLYITLLSFDGILGKIETLLFALGSLWKKRCYVLVLPIPPPTYLKVFAWYINHLTNSRMVALDSPCGFILPGGPFPSGQFVGKGNYIPARVDSMLYYESANEMLRFLGYQPVDRTPFIDHVDIPETLDWHFLEDKKYIALHITASGEDRSLPTDRWNHILKAVAEQLPDAVFAFSGTRGDLSFIQEAVQGMDEKKIRYIIGVSAQELLTVYAHARMCVTVQTGNAHLINMMHLPAITVDFKGVHMFRFSYNEKGRDLYSEIGCTCNPLERRCSMVEYKGKDYMACLFNLKDEDIVREIVEKYHHEH
jgi:hypothetical protein